MGVISGLFHISCLFLCYHLKFSVYGLEMLAYVVKRDGAFRGCCVCRVPFPPRPGKIIPEFSMLLHFAATGKLFLEQYNITFPLCLPDLHLRKKGLSQHHRETLWIDLWLLVVGISNSWSNLRRTCWENPITE